MMDLNDEAKLMETLFDNYHLWEQVGGDWGWYLKEREVDGGYAGIAISSMSRGMRTLLDMQDAFSIFAMSLQS